MNPIEKQILKNQEIMMSTLSTMEISKDNSNLLLKEINNTNELLNPKEDKKENACDMKETYICRKCNGEDVSEHGLYCKKFVKEERGVKKWI